MIIQSILFDKSKNSLYECIAWLKKHDYTINMNTYNFDSKNYFRFRQTPPNSRYYYTMQTIDKKRGIKFVLAKSSL
jgi:hypothetical protein